MAQRNALSPIFKVKKSTGAIAIGNTPPPPSLYTTTRGIYTVLNNEGPDGFILVFDVGAIHVFAASYADATSTYLGKFENAAFSGTSQVLVPYRQDDTIGFVTFYNPDTGKLVTIEFDQSDIPASTILFDVAVADVDCIDTIFLSDFVAIADTANDQVKIVNKTDGSVVDTATNASLVGVTSVIANNASDPILIAAGPNGVSASIFDETAGTLTYDDSAGLSGVTDITGIVLRTSDALVLGYTGATPKAALVEAYATAIAVTATTTLSSSPMGVAKSPLYGVFVTDTSSYYGNEQIYLDATVLSGARSTSGIPYSRVPTTQYDNGSINTLAYILILATNTIEVVDITTITDLLS